MAKTQAEKQKAYRDRKRNAPVTNSNSNAPVTVEGNAPHCRTCGGPVQHPKVVKCLKCCTGSPAPPNTIAEQVDRDIHEPVGPLDIYSEHRWAYLQSRGHTWDAGRQRSTRPAGADVIVGVTVPGDPAYKGIAS